MVYADDFFELFSGVEMDSEGVTLDEALAEACSMLLSDVVDAAEESSVRVRVFGVNFGELYDFCTDYAGNAGVLGRFQQLSRSTAGLGLNRSSNIFFQV